MVVQVRSFGDGWVFSGKTIQVRMCSSVGVVTGKVVSYEAYVTSPVYPLIRHP